MLSAGFRFNIFETKQSNLNPSAAPKDLSYPCWELKENGGNRNGNAQKEKEKETE